MPLPAPKPRPVSPEKRSPSETGRLGEEQAARDLSRSGWAILARNWRTRRGEIDIIALDGDTIVFVEVKTWPHGAEDDLAIAIGPAKRKRMAETAKCFLDTHRQYNGMYARFDVILASSVPNADGTYRFRHLRDAFSERVE
jgi:putative endonuclease